MWAVRPRYILDPRTEGLTCFVEQIFIELELEAVSLVREENAGFFPLQLLYTKDCLVTPN